MPSPKSEGGSENLERSSDTYDGNYAIWRNVLIMQLWSQFPQRSQVIETKQTNKKTHLSIIAKQNDVKKKGNTSFMDVIAKTESTLWWYLRLCLNSGVFTYFILSHIHKASSGFLNFLLPSSALRQVGSTCIRIWLNNHTLERNLSICLLST